MKNHNILAILIILSAVISIFGSGLTFYAADNFYQSQDRIDSTKSKSAHYVDVGLGLDGIGGTGLSFHSDAMYSNGLTAIEPDGITRASTRSPLQFTTAHLDWINAAGTVDCKLGRQMYTNLAIETLDLDGLRVAITPNLKTMVNLGGGLVVPSPEDTLKKIISNANILLADFRNTSIPLTTLNGAFAIEKSLHGESDLRVALGTCVEPMKSLRFDGTGRFSTGAKGIDHLDGRLTYMPSGGLNMSAFFISEKGRIDSLNYFTVLMHEQLTELGCRLDYFPEGGGCVQAGYHVTSVKNEGSDHFFLINAASQVLEGGIVFGIGSHGMTVRPHGGCSFALGKYVFLKGSGEYLLVDEKDSEGTHQMVALSGGLKCAFYPIGLTIYPRVEYITNRYYSQDVRLLVTTSLLIHNFWGNDE
jgi:hypothetical protein